MAKQIKGSDIIEPRHLEEAVQQAILLKNAYLELDKTVKNTSTTLKNMVKGMTGGNVSEIKAITQAYKESNEAKKASLVIQQNLIKVETENERLNQQQIKTESATLRLQQQKEKQYNKEIADAQKLNSEYQQNLIKVETENERLNQQQIKTESATLRLQQQKEKQYNKEIADAQKLNSEYQQNLIKVETENERLNQQQIKTESATLRLQQQKEKQYNKEIADSQKLNSEYSKQSQRLNDLRKQYKDLILVQGRETDQTRKMLKEITALDNKLKKVDATVGQHQRNVGHYSSAINKLSGFLGQLGLAFSAFTIAQDVFKTMVDFEKATASLSSITGATGEKLDNLKGIIKDLSTEMKVSVTEVTKLFEIVGSQMPQLLDDAEGMRLVAESAITLSKASGDTVENSTLAMASVMNQFSLAATEAGRVMNVLAAGSLVGSAGIADVSESMKNVGSVASGANVSVEETVALIEVLGKFGLTGAEAGTKLRGSILKLQDASFGYASGQFEINDALAEAQAHMATLGTQMEKDAFLQKTFGAENISTGRILLSNTKLFEEYTKGVTDTNTATEQAAVNSDTMSTVIKELKAAWENLVVKWMDGTDALGTLKSILRFVADNLETIVNVVIRAVASWYSYRMALMLWNKEGSGVIQNLLRMFTALKKSEGGMKGFGNALKSISFAGWVGILTTLIPMLWDMGKAIYESFNATTALDRATEEYNKQITEERAKMDLLRYAIETTNAGSKERQKVIDEINSTYGTTLQNLEDETAFMNQLWEAYQKVNAEMEKRIMKKILEDELTELFKAKRELEKTSITTGFGVDLSKTFLDKLNAQIAEIKAEMYSLNQETSKVGKTNTKLGAKDFPIKQLGNDAKTTTEEIKDLRTEIEKMDVDKLYPDKKRLEGVDVSIFDPKSNPFVDAMVKANEEAARLEHEAMERRKKLAQESIDLMKKITQAMTDEIDKRIAKEQEQIEASKSEVDYLRDQAKLGNTDAAASIKAEQIAQSKQLLEIEKLEKKKRNLLILTTALESASQKINSGDAKAFANAGQEIADFIAKLPKFYEGSEGTISQALGKPDLSGKDGYIVRVDGSEKVLNPKQSAMTGSMTTDEIANAAVMYKSNQLIAGKVMSYNYTSTDDRIVNRLHAVENAIKNIDIPEHHFNFDEQVKVMTETVKTKNRILKNHQKIGGLFS